MKRAFIIVLAVAAGCGPKEVTKFVAAPPAAQLSQGWRNLPVSDIGASINAPDDWRTPAEMSHVFDMSQFGGEGERTITDESMKQDLKIPDEMIKQQNEAAKLPDGVSLQLMKRGVIGETSTPTQIELRHRVVQGGTTVKAAAEEVAGRYMGSAKSSDVTLPIGPAVKITMTTHTRDGETGHHIHYVMVNNEDVYDLHLQTEQQANTISDIAQGVAESFRLSK